jgi:hypothetical protein
MAMDWDVMQSAADQRAHECLAEASVEVARTWGEVQAAIRVDPPEMGLCAGDRPAADVEVLAGAVASCEYLLAARMHAASAAGSLPFGGLGGMLAARGWSTRWAHQLARCGAMAAGHPSVAAAWAAGVITSEHVDPVARAAERFSTEELAAVVAELDPHWGSWSPAAIARFVAAAARLLRPPPDPTAEEADAYASRTLSFAISGESILLSGELPRVEGEMVIAAIDALAERLRSTANQVPPGARRADALVQLVNAAHAADLLPSRGGLPVSVTVTLEQTSLGEAIWTTSRGHLLTEAESRWASCDAAITPVLLDAPGCDEPGPVQASFRHPDPSTYTPATRLAALAASMFDTRIPLDVGRTLRTATAAQRRALAVRDGGCVIPGCPIPAEACQTHHLVEWSEGGATTIENMTLLCWAHHRQVDLRMWTIEPRQPGLPLTGPAPGSPAGAPWPANNGAPFVIRRKSRQVWRT